MKKCLIILLVCLCALFLSACEANAVYVGRDEPSDLDSGAISDALFRSSKYGCFDGLNIQVGANYCNTLIDMFGYEFDDVFNNTCPQVYLMHPDFPALDFYVHPYHMDMTENHTKHDVLANGFGSYHVNAAYCATKPDMIWGGLGFGASANDIIKLYGEPNYYDLHDLHIVLGYDFGNCEIDFRVYDSDLSLSDCEDAGISEIPDAGLQGVDFYVF